MYRLLIVTKDSQIESMFASMENWEAMGYKAPRIRSSAEDAIACMKKHHVDAIAVGNDAEFEPVLRYLDEKEAHMPIFQIKDSPEEQMVVLAEVYQLLTQIHSDHCNDDYGESYYFQMARERWMKTVLSGLALTREDILAHHKLYRCTESVTQPCIFTRLTVPSGDVFLAGRWHYGKDRLEVALRNFFGIEHEKMTVHIAVVAPEEVRVLVFPKPEHYDSATFSAEHVLGYIEETIDTIEEYLGLKMNVIDVRGMENLTAFAAKKE